MSKQSKNCDVCGSGYEAGGHVDTCNTCGDNMCEDCMLECPDCGEDMCTDCEGNCIECNPV